MRNAAIRISRSYRVPAAYRRAMEMAGRQYGAVQQPPDALGGYLDFTDWRGRPISLAHFVGRWTLLYFGYSRCQGSCRRAAPVIAEAAGALRQSGLAAKALFVDIDAAPLPSLVILDAARDGARHRHELPKRLAMAQLAQRHDGALVVASGDRRQLSLATQAYHVLREHSVPTGEDELPSINHSSLIYLLGTDAMVAGYGYHDMPAQEIVSLVTMLSQAPRRDIDRAAIRARNVQNMCGATTTTLGVIGA